MLRYATVILLGATISIAGCDTKVQQVKPPRLVDDSDSASDMQAEPEKKLEPVEVKKEDMRAVCCHQCAAAVKKDRTGDAPEKIPCVDFTSELDEDCLKWFRKHKMNAAEGTKCAAETPLPKKPAEKPTPTP